MESLVGQISGGRNDEMNESASRVPMMIALMVVSSIAGFAAWISPAQSTPENLSAFNKKYGTAGKRLDTCLTCHTSEPPGKDNLNPYGAAYAKSNHDFGAIEPQDSDGDGFTNIDEIKASTFPGDPKDNPNTKTQGKAAPSTTTTTAAPFPFSLLPKDLPQPGK
jgi:hypothetical protein